MSSVAELQKAIESYQSLIAKYTLARERILLRLPHAADEAKAELFERLEMNGRTIEALTRALEAARSQLELKDQGPLNGPGSD